MGKERLDLLLVSKGLAASREKAKAFIMAGNVYVDGQKEDKAGSLFPEESNIELKGEKPPFVSRGGLKLDKAVKEFGLCLKGLVCMDIGASTGGFTDCMLQNGAVKVYAVDVGHGQLDWGLRNDSRVVCMEKTNIRYIKPEDVKESIDFASADVSFISLTKILEPVKALLSKEAQMVCLIKPQFEAGRQQVGKKGVVRDKSVHEDVIRRVCKYAKSLSLVPVALSFSPIKGPEGNIEYLVHLKNETADTDIFESGLSISGIVEEAHKSL